MSKTQEILSDYSLSSGKLFMRILLLTSNQLGPTIEIDEIYYVNNIEDCVNLLKESYENLTKCRKSATYDITFLSLGEISCRFDVDGWQKYCTNQFGYIISDFYNIVIEIYGFNEQLQIELHENVKSFWVAKDQTISI